MRIKNANRMIGILTVGFIKVGSGPEPKNVSIKNKTNPPKIIPNIPATVVKKTDSRTTCLLISTGVAPIARLIPISLVRSFTVINKI